MDKVNVWSTTEKNKTTFYVGRKPLKATFVGEWVKLYDPNTGTTSEFYTYLPSRAQQPSDKWLYERKPR